MKNPYAYLRRAVLFSLSGILLSGVQSCKIAQGVTMMNKKTPDESTVRTGDKTITFIPIMHFGRKEFYARLKQKVIAYKQQGYTVYYEQIRARYGTLQVSQERYDSLRRMYRKMSGGQGHSRGDYKESLGDVFKNKMVQPLYDSLGVTATDVNADVDLVMFITEYERLYGPVPLDSCDLHTPLGAAYTCNGLPRSRMRPVVGDFRNRQLAATLLAAAPRKILVLYGAAHIKPVKKLLKRQKALATAAR
ncbi:hypothetical protein [Taibaiella chishuiensis]|uniref:TraB family protein n=1 Tax=Taibaiella chishuiensis TaxID=1434707 RepID=A0A2P8CV15_9BACT|nr:hypothetical protein [Taibaiella chishuiensis]PSK88797.1 hypothetical protein B0I18_1148 [Taibaiella chishuiensis]